MYDIQITPEGIRHLGGLPKKVRDAALALAFGALASEPRRVGKPLVGELAGLYSARRGDYRAAYEIDDEASVVSSTVSSTVATSTALAEPGPDLTR